MTDLSLLPAKAKLTVTTSGHRRAAGRRWTADLKVNSKVTEMLVFKSILKLFHVLCNCLSRLGTG